MNPDHPCYPHKATCDWCRICRHGDCCDQDEREDTPAGVVDAIGTVV